MCKVKSLVPAKRRDPCDYGVQSALVSHPMAAVQLKEVGGGAFGTLVKLQGLE